MYSGGQVAGTTRTPASQRDGRQAPPRSLEDEETGVAVGPDRDGLPTLVAYGAPASLPAARRAPHRGHPRGQGVLQVIRARRARPPGRGRSTESSVTEPASATWGRAARRDPWRSRSARDRGGPPAGATSPAIAVFPVRLPVP